MVDVILSEDNIVAVQCAGRTYLLSVGEDKSLYIEEEGQPNLTVAVSDGDNTVIIQGHWLNLIVQPEE